MTPSGAEPQPRAGEPPASAAPVPEAPTAEPPAPAPAGATRLRGVLAVLLGAALAAVLALILGEYPFTGATPYLAALAVPAVIGFATGAVARGHVPARWAGTGVLSAAGIGWALWISTGRGVDPVPAGGWVAIALALVWPVVVAVALARRRPPPAGTRRPPPPPPGTENPSTRSQVTDQ